MTAIYKKSIIVFLLAILLPTSAFADGGIPFWINTIQTVAATSGIGGLGSPISSFIITLICLALIILFETLFLKQRYFKATNTTKIIAVVSVSNLVSTVFGGLFLWCVFSIVVFTSNSDYLGHLILGPLYGVLEILPQNSIVSTFGFIFIVVFYNVFFCLLSYFIELFITKRYFKEMYDNKVISKGILFANIFSYMLSFFLMLPIYYLLHGILRI